MRRHDARKWLHAILDLLPVILIPVFMIYSHRHTIDSYTLEVPQNQVVTFNQLFEKDTDSEHYENYYFEFNNISQENQYFSLVLRNQYDSTHKYLVRLTESQNSNNSGYWLWSSLTQGVSNFNYSSLNQVFQPLNSGYFNFGYVFNATSSSVIRYYKGYLGLYDLTLMFGVGNEPTAEQFLSYLNEPYYEYNIGTKQLLNTGTITYDNTDILSQFTYNLYNSVDKYFNMNNVFGLNDVYNWFNLNIFNGNAPLYIYIIWNIVLYEFVMDLLMLLYALFMWFIDFCEDLIDRCFTTSKGGKH